MTNYTMQRKLKSNQAIDLSGCDRTPEGDYILDPSIAIDDMDLCDAKTERWIWSVGKHKTTGQIVASVESKFYQNSEYECIWLR